jgi:hypothetical protein
MVFEVMFSGIYRCEMSIFPSWPFAYEKYDGQSVELKVYIELCSLAIFSWLSVCITLGPC